MAEKPMLFNTEMVRAILDGRKRQTRRLLKNIPLHEPYFDVVDGMPCACDEDGDWYPAVEFSPIRKGDVLYVRETWCELPVRPDGKDNGRYTYVYYKADGDLRPEGWRGNWRPSIHMPKAAARLFLRVTGVRCERLQDIKPLDIKAEGIKIDEADEFDVEVSPEAMERFAFEELWDSTVNKDAMARWGWEANPWVWVIEFERCKKP